MNKEKVMEFISNAIDQGAKIDILFYGLNKTNIEAKQACQEFSQLVDGEVNTAISSRDEDKTIWYKVKTEQFQLDHFFREYIPGYMQEDVNLDGGDDHAA